MPRETIYVAVRLDAGTGEEFLDLTTAAFDVGNARRFAGDANRHGPAWREGNPVQRIGRFRVEEVGRR